MMVFQSQQCIIYRQKEVWRVEVWYHERRDKIYVNVTVQCMQDTDGWNMQISIFWNSWSVRLHALFGDMESKEGARNLVSRKIEKFLELVPTHTWRGAYPLLHIIPNALPHFPVESGRSVAGGYVKAWRDCTNHAGPAITSHQSASWR